MKYLQKKENLLAILDAPVQSFYLKSIFININKLKLCYLFRKNWKIKINLINKYFEEDVRYCYFISVLAKILFNRIFYKRIVIGSHRGKINKFLIITSLISGYRTHVLDDGAYSVFEYNWLIKLSTVFNKRIFWHSAFYRNPHESFLLNFCSVSYERNKSYKDTCFFVMSDFDGFSISENDEEKIINRVIQIAENDNLKIKFVPHRRGRFDLYERMNLDLFDYGYIGFENWYINSNFSNCKVISYNSSIWQILEDERVDMTLLVFFNQKYSLDWIKNQYQSSNKFKVVNL